MTRTKNQKTTTIFARIMLGLTLPLLLLTAVFAAIQLSSEMRTLGEFYQIKSRFAFESVYRTLDVAFRDKKIGQNEAVAVLLLERLSKAQEDVGLCVMNLLERKVLPENCSAWDDSDTSAAEASLLQKEQGRPYLVRVQKNPKKISAFMPLKNPEGNLTWIARAEMPLGDIREALISARWSLVAMFIMTLFTGFSIGYRLSKSIVKPIIELDRATQEIVKGNLGKHVQIATGDEIERLALTFNKMSDSLQEMKQNAQDANPLTGLPGNQGIFKELKKRIHERQKFVLFHTDLDRFKVFNDHFGLAKGDEAIKQTADLLRKTIQSIGSEDDFIGHQGGDDFVLITRPSRAKAMGDFITQTFDQEVVRSLYPKEDVERGYTLQMDRRRLAETGEEVMAQFPLLAISLAGVSNAKKDFADYFECMSAAVTVKKEVKKIIQSSYMIKE